MNIKKIIVGAAAVVTIAASTITPAFASQSASIYGPVATFTSCATGGNPTQNTFGYITIHASEGILYTTVVLKNALPNTTYDIYVNQDPGDCPTTPTGTVTTNKYGYGTALVSEPLVPGATNFWISAVGGTQVLRSGVAQLPNSSSTNN